MKPEQRQMIKEAYQEGYYQALDEGFFSLLKNLIRGGKAATRVTPTTGVGDILNRIDDLSKQLDDLDYKIPNMDELMRNKYIRPDGTIDTDKVRDALLDKEALVRLLRDIERRKRLDDYAKDLGLDPDDLDLDDFGDIG